MLSQYKEILEEAKSKGYLLAKWGKTDAIEEEYYEFCEKGNLPLIKAYAGNKYADVSIDLITSSYSLSEEGQDRIAALYRKYTKKPSSVSKGRAYCSVDKIPNALVDILGKELVKIYEECKMERSG